MHAFTSLSALVLLAHAIHAAPVHSDDDQLIQVDAAVKNVHLLTPRDDKPLYDFAGPLRNPTANVHAEAATPIGDICADVQLNARDRARCQEEDKKPVNKADPPAPAPAPQHNTKHDDDDDDKPKPIKPKAKPQQEEIKPKPKPKSPSPAPAPKPKEPCHQCEEDDSALVRVHGDVDLRPLLDLCLDIVILGDRQDCERDVRAGKKPKTQKHQDNAKPKPKPQPKKPVVQPQHRPNKPSYPCSTGHRYSPVLEACVALTLGAPRPDKDGACPAHWAFDWELLVCVAVSVNAPKPARGRCPDGWGLDAVLAVCVSLDLNHDHGSHYDGQGNLIDAAATVKLGGEREKKPTSDARSCPPGHEWDSILGCSVIGVVASIL